MTITSDSRKVILILTNREDVTADYVVLELKRRAIPFFRFNTEDFPKIINLSLHITNELQGFLSGCNYKLPINDIRSVWYRRPSLPCFDEPAMDPGIREFCTKESYYTLEGLWALLDVFWISNPFNIRKAENKPFQLQVASRIGFQIPQTLISNNQLEIKRFLENNEEVIIKPVRTATLQINKEENIIFTNTINQSSVEHIALARFAPSIYQEKISKKYDIRVTAIGEAVFATEIHSQKYQESQTDWRRGENPNIPHKKHVLPPDIERKCIEINKVLGLQFSAIDLILATSGQYYFLEINPNGQWAWIEERTGYKLTQYLVDLLCEN